ncbi:MAG: EamA family transporter RarD [Spirochaetaceae bacterium]
MKQHTFSSARTSREPQFVTGVFFALGAFLFWGFAALYWYPLRGVSSFEILQHRVIWAFVMGWAYLLLRRQVPVDLLRPERRGELLLLLGAGLLVSVNWFVYVFAVTGGRTVEASLGYYINPLVSVLLGTLVLGEKLLKLQRYALLLATAGVAYLTWNLGYLPWISVVLAFSFGLYGLIKKRVKVTSMQGLAVEMVVVAPAALTLALRSGIRGEAAFMSGIPLVTALLVGGGVVTIIPLMLFAKAAMRIPLSSVGFIQYLAPTIMLLIGVFAFGEPFPLSRLPGFILVWIALATYTISILPRRSALRRVPQEL